MESSTPSSATSRRLWALARRQHGVVSRAQLTELGLTARAVQHRLQMGRLHRVHRGIYSVGRPELGRHGRWMAAVLASGPGALLSHSSAAELWGIQPASRRRPEVSVSRARDPRPRGVRVHRRSGLGGRDVAERGGIPVTSPLRTLIDLASFLPVPRLEAAVNAADRLDLVHPPELRLALTRRAAMPGIARLRKLLDRDTFVLTDSDLERRFLAIVRRTGLPRPETGRRIGGFKVDFHWPRLGLVVETDGLRYHRTAAQQARDRRRDQAHAGMGLTTLRFTHDQVAHEPREVQTLLERVAARLATRAA